MPTTDNSQADIKWALEALELKRPDYLLYSHYFAGHHALMIDQRQLRTIFGELFERFRLNLCSAVIDALVGRLEVSGFGSGEEAAIHDAEDIWQRNRMDRQSREVHQVAASAGDAFVVVWPDGKGEPVIYPQQPHEVCVSYSAENPGTVIRAAKLWAVEAGKEDESSVSGRGNNARVYHRLNLYYPDRIEKYRTKDSSVGSYYPTSQGFIKYEVPGESWPLPNIYNEVPVFHFANNGSIGKPGVSELRDAVPIQNWMNYTVFSLLVGQEFQSFPQRYAIGVEVPKDADGNSVSPFKTGPDRMWIANPEDRDKAPIMGQLEAADLTKLIAVKKEISLTMAQVTGTPASHFSATTDQVSGESQKTMEGKLDTKVKDRTSGFGDTWGAVMALAVKMTRGARMDGLTLECEWADTKPRNELEQMQIATLKSSLGVSRRQVLRELGYTDDQIDQFEEEGGELGQAPSVTRPNLQLDDPGPGVLEEKTNERILR